MTKNILKSIFKVLKKTQGYYQVPKLRNIPTMFGTTIAITITSNTTTTTQGLWSYGERSLRKLRNPCDTTNTTITIDTFTTTTTATTTSCDCSCSSSSSKIIIL